MKLKHQHIAKSTTAGRTCCHQQEKDKARTIYESEFWEKLITLVSKYSEDEQVKLFTNIIQQHMHLMPITLVLVMLLIVQIQQQVYRLTQLLIIQQTHHYQH